MLVSIEPKPWNEAQLWVIQEYNVQPPREIHRGVYELEQSFNLLTDLNRGWSSDVVKANCYPELPDLNAYGVCDRWEQVITRCPEVGFGPRNFALSVTPIRKSECDPSGGWRWHKWGPYIGIQEPTTEYLYDEPVIELVYCYHVYQIPEEWIKK